MQIYYTHLMYANKTRIIFKKDTLRFDTPYIYILHHWNLESLTHYNTANQVRKAGQIEREDLYTVKCKQAANKRTHGNRRRRAAGRDHRPGIYHRRTGPQRDTSYVARRRVFFLNRVKNPYFLFKKSDYY